MDNQIKQIFENIKNGDAKEVVVNVQAAIDSGTDAKTILNEGMIAAMAEVGSLFEEGEFFVPEMLIAGRAMQFGLNLLKPYLVEADVQKAGTVVIGTVKGDLHDIGKNLVGLMLEGAGFDVIDLGTDVAPEQFIAAAKEHNAEIIALSALLTTTMVAMKATVEAFKAEELSKPVKIMVGGAPVTESYATEIGADGFASDASRAVTLAMNMIGAGLGS